MIELNIYGMDGWITEYTTTKKCPNYRKMAGYSEYFR
jgi:hypothetical protein